MTNPLPLQPAPQAHGPGAVHYELRFEPLGAQAGALAFPCDAAGHVFLDALSEPAKRRYLYARVVLGREFAPPAVVASTDV